MGEAGTPRLVWASCKPQEDSLVPAVSGTQLEILLALSRVFIEHHEFSPFLVNGAVI